MTLSNWEVREKFLKSSEEVANGKETYSCMALRFQNRYGHETIDTIALVRRYSEVMDMDILDKTEGWKGRHSELALLRSLALLFAGEYICDEMSRTKTNR